MISYGLQRLSRAVLGGFLIGSSLIGYAQDDSTPGVVRITDARPAGVPVLNAGFHRHKQADCPELGGVVVDGCPTCPSDCPSGDCHHKHCHHGHCHLSKCFREHYCKHSPDHGYSIPEKHPIYRRGVQYNQYFPSGWYGTPGGGIAPGTVYPTIYQPTDTTQLGFYYQHVPFWMPKADALPARPIPAQWHVLAPPAEPHWNKYGWGNYYHHGLYAKCHHKSCFHGKHGHDCPPGDGVWVECPTPVMTTPAPAAMPNGTPNTLPTDTEAVPGPPVETGNPPAAPIPDDAPPRNDSARNPHIRRAGFRR